MLFIISYFCFHILSSFLFVACTVFSKNITFCNLSVLLGIVAYAKFVLGTKVIIGSPSIMLTFMAILLDIKQSLAPLIILFSNKLSFKALSNIF